MQKEKLWAIITQKNPHFVTSSVTLTPSGLKKLFDTAWEKGHKQGLANGRVLGEREAKKANPFADFDFLKRH